MKEFIEYLVKNLVESPDSVDVRCLDGEQKLVVEIRVAENDVGKVVGRGGRTINALRTIVAAIGARVGRPVRLDLIQ